MRTEKNLQYFLNVVYHICNCEIFIISLKSLFRFVRRNFTTSWANLSRFRVEIFQIYKRALFRFLRGTFFVFWEEAVQIPERFLQFSEKHFLSNLRRIFLIFDIFFYSREICYLISEMICFFLFLREIITNCSKEYYLVPECFFQGLCW